MTRFEWLFNRINFEFRQLVEFVQYFISFKCTVGIESYFNVVPEVSLAYILQYITLLIKVKATYFQFDALKTLCNLLIDLTHRKIKIAHPDKTVDGYRCTVTKIVFKDQAFASMLQIKNSRFKSEFY